MIFNTALPAGGGGSSQWTDVSSVFAAALNEYGFASVFAYTDGTIVYLNVQELSIDRIGEELAIDLPSGYAPMFDMEVMATVQHGTTLEEAPIAEIQLITAFGGHPSGALAFPEPNYYDSYSFTIIYPIA